MARKIAALQMALILALLVGCGSVGVRHTPQTTQGSSGAKIGSYQMLEVRPFTTAEGLEGFGEHVVKIRELLLRNLPPENLFPTISAESKPEQSNGVLVFDAKLVRAKSVSTTQRVMFGMMAGRSGIETEVTLTDKSNGKQVAKELILVQSSLSAGAFSATDRQTIEEAARAMINFLRGLR